MKDFQIEFTDKEITPWAGILMLKKMLDRMNFDSCLKELDLPVQGSNRGYCPHQLIKQFMTSVWCGANKFEHTEVTRQDEVIRQFWGFDRMAGHKSFQRFFNKFDLARNQKIFTPLYQWFFKNLQFDNFTLDVDSTVHTRYGSQQGAKKGYNPKKPGRLSHHPLMAFVADCKMVANFWLRSGDAYSSNHIEAFLDDTLEKLQGKKVGLFRADSGFYDKKVFNYLERKSINYIIAVRLYAPVQQLIASNKTWMRLSDGIEIAESTYQSPLWEKPRRMVMLRQHIPTRPKATGRSLKLFEQEGIYKQYRYSCFITSLDLPSEQIWTLYRQRADAENRIKELKYDFGSDSFNQQSFFATEASLNFVMMAYNFISLFRQVVLGKKVHEQMKTLRYNVFAIGGYITKNGNQRIIKLSLAMKRREWFTGLWMNTNSINAPLSFTS
jgi:Transposase DDE domain group 1